MKKIIFTLAIVGISLLGFSQKPEMVYIEGGSFYMGNDYSGALDEKPEHKVTVDDFYISKYEVTFEMYDNFCKATGHELPSDGQHGRGKNAVINVSWESAVKYCNWLSTRFGFEKVYDIKIDSMGMKIEKVNWDADGFRLPTEAEWEYVAKGGSKSQGYAFAGSNEPKEIAWYRENSKATLQPVGTLKPNELGVYDMLGNAYEWCWDFYDESYYGKKVDQNPRGADKGDRRVYRGGNFESTEEFIRITRRYALNININSGLIGIRLVQNKNAKQ